MLANIIPTRVHGVLDYMTSAMLVTLPRVLGWNAAPTRVLDIAAGGIAAYSLATDYELGVARQLPMKAHLTLDIAGGAGLLFASAYLLDDEDAEVRGTIAAIGAYEIITALMSKTAPNRSPRRARPDPSPLMGEEEVPGAPVRLFDPTIQVGTNQSQPDIAAPT